MKLLGANILARIVGLDRLPVKSNYLIGEDPAKWRTEIPNYSTVKYQNVYPDCRRRIGIHEPSWGAACIRTGLSSTEAVLGLPVADFQSTSHQMRDPMPVSPPADSKDSKSAIGNLPTAPTNEVEKNLPARALLPSSRQVQA